MAGYSFDYIKDNLKKMEADMSLANKHRLWKPHSMLKQLVADGELDADFYRTVKVITLLMSTSMLTKPHPRTLGPQTSILGTRHTVFGVTMLRHDKYMHPNPSPLRGMLHG